jgi:O-antigen ligase
MAACAWLVAASPRRAQVAGLHGMIAAATVVACLALVEGQGMAAIDPFLGLFRQAAHNVGGARRATAGSEYPNQAAAFIAYGLVALGGMAARGVRWLPVALGFLLSLGMLHTYSRAGLVAAAAGLVSLALARRDSGGRRLALALLAALSVSVAAFAAWGEGFGLRLASEGTEQWYGASYAPAESALALHPGEVRTTRVRVANLGRKAWSARAAFNLASHWYDVEERRLWDGPRTPLPEDVAPGASVVLEAHVEAPRKEGRYVLLWDMVHEHTTWFRERGVAPGLVPVEVSRRPVPGAAPPAAAPPSGFSLEARWEPRRMELWRIALGMWRERPLTGFGPDSFRRLYGPRAGHAAWDARVYANSLYLEAAATSGALGLLAIVGTLAAATRAALGRLQRALPGGLDASLAPTLLALLAGIAVHGALDYLLAFTGHYLAFGFVVGAAASPPPGGE